MLSINQKRRKLSDSDTSSDVPLQAVFYTSAV